MKQKALIALLCVAALALATLATVFFFNRKSSAQKPQQQDAAVHEKPDYYLQEGGSEIEGTNAKSLDIKLTKTGAQAVLSFVLGSTASGIDEADTDTVPAWHSFMTDSPSRFVLEFDDLSHWDYYRQFAVPDDSLFYDVFKQVQSDSNTFRIVFQLRYNCDVNVTQDKNTLIINFKQKETSDKTHYYAMSTKLAGFNGGLSTYADGYFPTLCSDLENVVLISQPFDSEDDAKQFASVAGAKLEGLSNPLSADALPDGHYILTLSGNTLPAYSGGSNLADVYTKRVISVGETPETLPVVMSGGLFLCMSLDGDKALFAKQSYDEDNDLYTDTLWLMDSAGKFRQLSEIEFASVSMAAFSPDGKKLGLIEQTSDTSYLYVYDMETNSLTNLGEEGLGTTTSTFIWDSLGTAIYAVSGTDTQKLQKFDFMIPDETARISSVEDYEMQGGDLGFYNGELYFTYLSDDEEQLIYKIKPEGGLRIEYAKGGDFAISQDGKFMALLLSYTADETGAEDGQVNNTTILKLKDMATGDEKNIVEDQYVLSYSWGPDNKLFYTVAKDASFNSEFSFTLVEYDCAADSHTAVCDLTSSEFMTTTNPEILFIPFIDSDDSHIRATYELTLKPGETPQGE